MKIYRYKTVSEEDAHDALSCLGRKQPIKSAVSVCLEIPFKGDWTVVITPLDLGETKVTREDFIVMRE